MAKLSLTARKDIKDSETKLQENLKTIETATGIAFSVEFDFPTFAPVAEERGYKDRIGTILHGWYLGGLANNIVTFCEDPIQKEAFIEMFGSAKRISFEFYDESLGGYNRTRNDNGTLMMGSRNSSFCNNAMYCGNDLSKTCSGDSPLNVATRKNIQDTEAARKENIGRINKAVGLEFQVEQDWVAMAKASAERGYADRVGEVINKWYLGGLADQLETLCKDEMSKEAVADACDKKTISFVLTPGKDGYGACTFVDGVLTATLPIENFCNNARNLGKDIESRL